MKVQLKLPEIWKCDFRFATLIGMGAGFGAATGYSLIPWWTIFFLPLLLLRLNRSQLKCFLIPFILCLLSGIIQHQFDMREISRRPDRKSTVSGEIRCIDHRTSSLSILDNPRTINAAVTLDGQTFPVMAIYPAGQRIIYGSRHRFTGVLIPPEPAGLQCKNGRITGEIPPLYGERILLVPDSIIPLEPEKSFWSGCFMLRDILLRQLLKNVRNPEAADMAAQLFLGASTGALAEQRRNFIRSGTIHIFSVSGLHVTLISGIILLLLRPVDFKWRYYIAALVTLLYVCCTGASLPAIRAGTMVILWCIMRANLFPSPSWNALMYTWSAFAFLAPQSVGTVSALYSFGITAALILLAHNMPKWCERRQQMIAMMPHNRPFTGKVLRIEQFLQQLIMIPAISFTAFAAGVGISLCSQQLFLPGSILANMLLIFFTPLLFGAMFFKFIAGPLIPWCDQAGAFLLEGTFYLLTSFTRMMSNIFVPHPATAPPWWIIAVFYVLFFGIFGSRSAILKRLCLTGTIIMLFIWQYQPEISSPQLTIINYGSNEPPAVAMTNPGSGTAWVVDVPSPDSGRLLGQLLARQGISKVIVNFSARNARSSGGIRSLAARLPVSIGGASGSRKSGRAFVRHIKDHQNTGNILPPSLPVYPGKSGRTEYIFPGNIRVLSQVTDRGRKISVQTPDNDTVSELIPWCSRPAVWQCEIK